MLKKLGIGCLVVFGLFALLLLAVPSRQPVADPPTTTTSSPGQATAGQVTPAPTSVTGRIGDRIRYPDGWAFTVQKFEEQPPPSPRAGANTPEPGMRFVVVTIRVDNGTGAARAPEPSDFKLQDSNGVRRGPSSLGFGGQARPDRLRSDDLAPGGFVVGTIVFEAPRDDQRLSLVYAPRRQAEAVVQLF